MGTILGISQVFPSISQYFPVFPSISRYFPVFPAWAGNIGISREIANPGYICISYVNLKQCFTRSRVYKFRNARNNRIVCACQDLCYCLFVLIPLQRSKNTLQCRKFCQNHYLRKFVGVLVSQILIFRFLIVRVHNLSGYTMCHDTGGTTCNHFS